MSSSFTTWEDPGCGPGWSQQPLRQVQSHLGSGQACFRPTRAEDETEAGTALSCRTRAGRSFRGRGGSQGLTAERKQELSRGCLTRRVHAWLPTRKGGERARACVPRGRNAALRPASVNGKTSGLCLRPAHASRRRQQRNAEALGSIADRRERRCLDSPGVTAGT